MKNTSKALAVFGLSLIVTINTAYAAGYWPPILTNWRLSIYNGVAYILSPEFPEHCSNSRGQINIDGTEYNKALYAYALSAKARGKKLEYIVDDTQTICVISGLQEAD